MNPTRTEHFLFFDFDPQRTARALHAGAMTFRLPHAKEGMPKSVRGLRLHPHAAVPLHRWHRRRNPVGDARRGRSTSRDSVDREAR